MRPSSRPAATASSLRIPIASMNRAAATLPFDPLAEHRRRIDAALDRYSRLGDEPDELSRFSPPRLTEAIRYSLLAPGKRLRPTLTLLAAEACGGAPEAALPAACAVEMVHCYSLIHDDLPAMDDDDLRRGRPTCHRQFDEATAILAGDALLTLAFEVLARAVQPAEVAARCCLALAQAAGPRGMVGGQSDDLAAERRHAMDERGDSGRSHGVRELEAIHARKTAALITAAVELGGLTARGSAEELAALRGYGLKLGLAFQIKDDLLDVAGQESSLGKRANKDSRRGKLTYAGLLGAAESARRAETLIAEAIAALDVFTSADGLRAVARFVLERDR